MLTKPGHVDPTLLGFVLVDRGTFSHSFSLGVTVTVITVRCQNGKLSVSTTWLVWQRHIPLPLPLPPPRPQDGGFFVNSLGSNNGLGLL